MLSPNRLLHSCRVAARSGIVPRLAGRRQLHQTARCSVRASARLCRPAAAAVVTEPGVSCKSFEAAPAFEAKTVLESTVGDGKHPIAISSSDGFLHIEDKGLGGWTRLHSTTLRDSCTCTTCCDPASGQKNFASTDVPADVEIENIRLADGGVGITFRNDIQRLARNGHEMVLPWTSIELALGHRNVEKLSHPRQDAIYPKTGRTFWDTETINKRIRRIDYHDFMKGDEAFWQTLLDLASLGLVFLKNVPHDPESIVHITTRIANIKETFYGRTFDVRAKPDAENVAYTSGYLGLHQDLLYLERPPAIQLLHCMENSCSGGESLFSDGLRAGKLLWLQENRNAVDNLARVLVPYHYEKHGYWYKQKRPLLSTTADGILGSVYWSPPFQNQFPVPTADLRPWLEPAQLFDTLINEETAMYQVKMLPGECVMFDNLRVMHGRRAFDASGGSRWLRGAYIEREDIVSRILHVPADMAEAYRAGEVWSREAEDQNMKASKWYADVKTRLEAVDKSLNDKGAKMGHEHHLQLNGELADVTV